MVDSKLVESLKEFLKEGVEWERKPTSIRGVFIMKIPAYGKAAPRLVVEVNPVDATGNPTKKRGLFLRSSEELKEYKRLLHEEKLEDLLKGVADVSPGIPERMKSAREVIEV
ncbi:MAG: hypothetical protein AB1476_02495 [Candidatus Hadarchaeota archaeon]